MCILLVEDEPDILEVMAESLRDAGYHVVEAKNGAEAVSIADSLPIPIKILVTDLHMPGDIDGSQLAAQLREAQPNLPVVIATGRPDKFEAAWQKELGYILLRKPYLPSRLANVVQSII